MAGKEYLASLAKGLAILSAFGQDRPSMSLTEAAAVAGLSRAAARRVLLTLSGLGYVVQTGRDFTPSPRVLELGFSYLSIQSWIEHAEPLMKAMSSELKESSFAAILHGVEAVVVARAMAPGAIVATSMTVGTRLPAFHSAMGRILLGYLEESEIWERLKATRLRAYTPNTIVDPAALAARVQADAAQGFSLVDEELERGLRAIAVPVLKRDGTPAGAINISAHANRVTRNEMREAHLPALRIAAERIRTAIV
jgi:IclR family pca regulon transcriptional regulator